MSNRCSDRRQIVIFTGRFGSGKTEIAINYTLGLAREGDDTRPTLIDLDIVTPYFRTRDLAQQLEEEGIRVVTPAEVAQHLDTPGITPQILGALQESEHSVVLDVGGDAQGARALGQFAPTLKALDYRMNFVVNPYRPFTNSVEGIRKAVTEIQATSRLQITALASNPNLIRQTTPDLIVEGHRLVKKAAQALALPVAFVSIGANLAARMAPDTFDEPVMVLRRFFVMPWEEDGDGSDGMISRAQVSKE